MQLVSGNFLLAATDLSNHLSCQHLTQLNRLVALGELKRPYWNDPALDVLIKRGEEHEAAYVDHLQKKGLRVRYLKGQPVDATLDAMRSGDDVLVQARLANNHWAGLTDILMKVPGQSAFGNWAYEVRDTKLAQNTRAATILQLCLYSDLLAMLQDITPGCMHVVKPGTDFPTESYRFADFQAYYRLVKQDFENIMKGSALKTYPDPVEHCSVCRWWGVCDQKRHHDDHLSLVAGIRTLHIEELQNQNITTLEAFANAGQLRKPERGNKETFERKQIQAKVQLNGRLQQKLLYQLHSLEKGRGLNRLPLPNAGDIYFDIEGDAFYPDGGLEYLLGFSFRNQDNIQQYNKLWSTNRIEEKKAFTVFMQAVTERWKRHPDLYVYHFAPYEPSVVKRLARVHAVFEKEVDDLLRAERFIDLHAVFKEALLASVERYSLKDLERFTDYVRKVELQTASKARKAVEVALELNDFTSLPPVTITAVEDYNEDDCLATEALHRWLEALRADIQLSGTELQRPDVKTGEASENVQLQATRAQTLFKALTRTLPEDRSLWTGEHKAKWLLAHQIDYFRREDKSAWWEYFRVHELEHEELLDERKAISGLQFAGELPKEGQERNITHRYRFPPQEVSIGKGEELIEAKGEKIGSVRAITQEDYTVDIKKTAGATSRHPVAVHVSERIDPGSLATSLMDFAASIDDDGLSHQWPYAASKDLLMKRYPMLTDKTMSIEILPHEDAAQAAIRIALALDGGVLGIQGPPGSGKTYTGAMMIIALVKAKKKIGITATSHRVIRNVMDKVGELVGSEERRINFVHKITDAGESVPAYISEVKDSKKAMEALQSGAVVGGTAWLWADKESVNTLDYLFVDEAGQMSLSHVLAASRAAKNIILLGDPQQLEQPQKGVHPEGSDIAGLAYLLDGHATMPAGKGLFLDITRRLHPQICRFTSELFYEGRLHSLPGLEKQVIGGGTAFDGAGLFYVPVEHKGNQNKSTAEITVVKRIVTMLLSQGHWTNAQGVTNPLTVNDVLIVAPYNAQVSALLEALPGMRIGTVDKFQGQEAPVVIYSMTASSVNDAPKGMTFLFNPNRLNVATSRAKCCCILLAAPKLLEPECHTIDQMRWANALCRYKEMATERRIAMNA